MAKQTKQIQPKTPELPAEVVWNIVEFANSLNSLYPSVFTPQLVNSRLKDITLTNGTLVNDESITAALNDPKNHEDQLLSISESLEVTSSAYKRIIEYLSGLPAFDLTYYCRNIEKESEYKSQKYQKDLDIVKDFLDRFDYKKEFGTVLKQLYREETFFSVFRDEVQKFCLQQLPSNYCLITGRWDYSPVLFSFNYTWFMQGGVSMDMYPPIFKETYAKLFIERGRREYNPALNIMSRNENLWALWGDCSPVDGFWGWKLSPEQNARIPRFASLFPDLSMQSLMRGLQKNSYMASAAKMILGEVAMLNKDQKATVKDAFSISPALLGNFLQLVKQAINNESVKLAAAPLTNMGKIEFEADNEIYSSYLRNTLGESGINSNLLFSANVRPNAIETQLSANTDEILSEQIYPLFNSFLTYQLSKRTRYYKFGFNFEGSNFYLDRQRRFDTQMALLPMGICNPQKIAASLGQNPFVFQSQLDEARVNNWIDKLTPVMTSFTQSKDGQSGGRPSKSDSDLTEEGSQTRSDGGNISKGGKK